ncbi:retrovirus-related pol polyprotein from transposon TNT 1-94 [Tanacetum coccineum]|uniref:Retrovirus-related pol polyprotein from transposon TNT 1-94 n=1 Tax=Tanacetum coccineum TaxID=301880 RepID=A0ABQ5E2Y4_9ASTR
MVVLTKRIDDMTKRKSEKGKKEKEKSEKGLIAESFDWDDESVSSDDEGSTKIRAFMAIVEEEPSVGKADARSGQWVDITMKKNLKNTVSINCSLQNEVIRVNLENESLKDEIIDLKKVIEKWTCSKVTLDQLLSKQVLGNIVKVLGGKGRRKEKISSKEVVFTKADESSSMLAPEITSNLESECDSQEPFSPLPKLIGAAPSGTSESLISLFDLTLNMADLTLDTHVSKKTRPSVKVSPAYVIKRKTEKSSDVPKPCSNKKADSPTEQLLLTLMEEVKGLKRKIEIPSSTSPSCSQPSSSKVTKQKTCFGPCKHCGFKNNLSDDCYLKPKCSTCGSTDHLTKEHLEHVVVKKTLSKLKAQSPLKPSPKKAPMIPKPFKECKYYGFNDHHSDHCEFYLGCEVCGLPQEESGPKVVFRDDSSGDIEGISQLCDANYKILFTKTQGTIYNQNDKVALIAPRRRDVYVIDMSSFNKESNACFFAKASPSVNWLWHKRLTHLNFKNINDLAKHNLVSGLSSLTLSKGKSCLACEKGKHLRDHSKQRDHFPLTNEYSRYTWIFCLKKKRDEADCIMYFIRKMENLNEVRVKELRSDNGTEFRNHKLEEFCNENGISQNFSSPCTPEQNSVAKRRNKTLIEAARTMLNSAKLPKQFWGEVVNTACYTQNRSIIVKRHGKTSYDVFRGRSPDISYFYVFRCPVHIHNHWDHLGKFDEKADDGFFLGYSPVAKAFRVFNIRRQEMEEIVHVTFSEDDEAISQSSTEGDAINFNENRSFLDDEFLEPKSEVTQCPINTEYFPYIPTYENTTPSESLILQVSVTSEDPPEFTKADNHPALNEPDQTVSADHFEPADLFESAEPQINVIIEPINRWSREKHIELVNIIGEPLAGITTRSRIRDSDVASAFECLYVNFLSEIEPKKLIEALEEEGWIIAMQEELN